MTKSTGRPAGSPNRRTARTRRNTCYVTTMSSLEANLGVTVLGVNNTASGAKKRALKDAVNQHDPDTGPTPTTLTWTPQISDHSHTYHARHDGVDYVITRTTRAR